jgi:hypothetical protein
MPNESKFSAPGMVLWAVDVELEHDVFRSGAAKKTKRRAPQIFGYRNRLNIRLYF